MFDHPSMLPGYPSVAYPAHIVGSTRGPFSAPFTTFPLPTDTTVFPIHAGALQTIGQPTPGAVTSCHDSEAGFLMRLLCDTFGSERERLGIPKDPQLWNCQHVRNWLNWTVREFSITGLDLAKFAIFDGPAICHLTQEQFVELCPPFVGDILFRHLQDLRRAATVDDYLAFGDFFGTADVALAADFVADLPEINPDDLEAMNLSDEDWPAEREQRKADSLASSCSSSSPSSPEAPNFKEKEDSVQTPSAAQRTPSVTSLCSTNSSSSVCSFAESSSTRSSPAHSPCPSPSLSGASSEARPSTPPRPTAEYEADSPTSTLSPTSCNGQVQLWQFLLELLTDHDAQCCITWTSHQWEFKLSNPEEVARRWGERKNKPKMNYEKLSRGLRYYYDKNIIHKVQGKRYVYKFVCDIEALLGLSWKRLQQFLSEPSSQPFSFPSPSVPSHTQSVVE